MSERQVNKAPQETPISTLEGVICCCAGNHIAPVYKKVWDEDLGKNVVKKVDEFDLFEFIQASKSSTDLATLAKRFIELGEIPGGQLGFEGDIDMTNMPGNIHEVYHMTNDVAAAFAKLPESVQKIFGDKDKYLAALLDGSYQKILIDAINNNAVPKEEPKKVDNNANE